MPHKEFADILPQLWIVFSFCSWYPLTSTSFVMIFLLLLPVPLIFLCHSNHYHTSYEDFCLFHLWILWVTFISVLALSSILIFMIGYPFSKSTAPSNVVSMPAHDDTSYMCCRRTKCKPWLPWGEGAWLFMFSLCSRFHSAVNIIWRRQREPIPLAGCPDYFLHYLPFLLLTDYQRNTRRKQKASWCRKP